MANSVDPDQTAGTESETLVHKILGHLFVCVEVLWLGNPLGHVEHG